MKTREHTKLQMVRHIRQLFKLRPEMFRGMSWDCVLREAKLMVIRTCSKKAADEVIMHCFLESGRVPSMLSTYLAVRKNWQMLAEVNIEAHENFFTGRPVLAASGSEMRHRGQSCRINYGLILSKTKSFFRK